MPATKEQLKRLAPPEKTITICVDGASMDLVVRGFTVGQIAEIQNACTRIKPDGSLEYDGKTDIKLSIIAAVKEPALNLVEDGEWVLSLPNDVAEQIISTAKALGARDYSSYTALKNYLKENAYVSRLYSVCANTFGRLPSELGDVSELEFNTALAAVENCADAIEEDLRKRMASNG